MSKFKSFLTVYYLPIVSGIFIGTSYIPFPPWASVFAFVPLWLFFRRATSLRQVLIGGWITQFVLTFIGFNWITFTVHEFGHMPWAISFIVLLAFCAISNLDVPVAGIVWFAAQRKWRFSPPTSLVLLALVTAFFEAWIPTLFPWNYGYTLYWAGLPAYQLAELIGFQGLSALVILTNILSFKIWEKRSNRKGLVKLAAMAVWIVALNLAGWALQKKLGTQ